MIFNHDPDLLTAAVPSLHIYFFGFVMMAFQFSGQSVFKSLNKPKWPSSSRCCARPSSWCR